MKTIENEEDEGEEAEKWRRNEMKPRDKKHHI